MFEAYLNLFVKAVFVENIALALPREDPQKLRARLTKTAEAYGLALQPDRHVHELSMGERQSRFTRRFRARGAPTLGSGRRSSHRIRVCLSRRALEVRRKERHRTCVDEICVEAFLANICNSRPEQILFVDEHVL